MVAIRSAVVLLAAVWGLAAIAGEPPFQFDRQQAIELAAARIRAEALKYPQSAVPGVDFEHPLVVAVRAQHRKFVFVSFISTLAKWGEYAAFEVCSGSSNVVPIASGKVIDIEVFREEVAKISRATAVDLRSVCG
jgi:hypothetical protein